MQHLVLERDPEQDTYYLLSGYSAYLAYKETGITRIECLVQSYLLRNQFAYKCLSVS
ncbi:MAG: hypothetical protein ACE3JP_02735 [Ectobacillus sp.]